MQISIQTYNLKYKKSFATKNGIIFNWRYDYENMLQIYKKQKLCKQN